MGSAAGALKVAAKRLGLTPNEYAERLANGELWCTGHREWHPSSAYDRDASRGRGHTSSCRELRNAVARQAYVARPRPSRGRHFVAARRNDRKQARRRVNYLVEAGILPAPNSLPCTDCGHVWAPGERRHEYDHHNGYAPEHHEDVECVCTRCHHARERARRGS